MHLTIDDLSILHTDNMIAIIGNFGVVRDQNDCDFFLTGKLTK